MDYESIESSILLKENIEPMENIFENNFIPKHYYPYLIQLYNLFSFKYLNRLLSPSSLALFSISRIRGKNLFINKKINVEYTAMYNIYYQYYSFNDKRFVTYDDLLNYVLNFN